MSHEHEHGHDCGCGSGEDAAKAAAFAAFERELSEKGLTMDQFAELPQHEQIKMLNKYLTSHLPQRKIGTSDWREAVEALLEVEPAEQTDDLFTLDDPNWSVIEIPATVTGSHADGFQSEKPIPSVHGAEHNVKTESVTMGVQVVRSLPKCPNAVLINFYQSWTKFSHVFCSIELERVKPTGEEDEEDEGAGKEELKFVRGVFHPGFVGLIDEDELEFIGFVESFVVDTVKQGENGDMLPGKWMKRRPESRLYRPGAPGADGRATLVDAEDDTKVYSADFLTKKVPNAV
jgi:hypothetical protein